MWKLHACSHDIRCINIIHVFVTWLSFFFAAFAYFFSQRLVIVPGKCYVVLVHMPYISLFFNSTKMSICTLLVLHTEHKIKFPRNRNTFFKNLSVASDHSVLRALLNQRCVVVTSVGTTGGQGIIRFVVVVVVVVVVVSDILIFRKILKVNKAQILTDLLSLVMSVFEP